MSYCKKSPSWQDQHNDYVSHFNKCDLQYMSYKKPFFDENPKTRVSNMKNSKNQPKYTNCLSELVEQLFIQFVW